MRAQGDTSSAYTRISPLTVVGGAGFRPGLSCEPSFISGWLAPFHPQHREPQGFLLPSRSQALPATPQSGVGTNRRTGRRELGRGGSRGNKLKLPPSWCANTASLCQEVGVVGSPWREAGTSVLS